MAYQYDEYDNSLVIDGFENGIADSPHAGLSNMQNVNVTSVPGEASVNFATSKITPSTVTGTATSVSSNTLTYTSGTGTLENGMAIKFSGVGSYTGISTATPYWVQNLSGQTFQLTSDYGQTTTVVITGSGSAAFSAYLPTTPKHFTTNNAGIYFMVDDTGQVWSNNGATGTNSFWRYTGNTVDSNSHGNGLVYYEASDGTGYVFVFHNSKIDYATSPAGNLVWVYGWKPSDASTGNASGYLKTLSGENRSHEAMVAPDSRVYYCDKNWVGRWYQTSPTTPFVPTTLSTYTPDTTALLPTTDNANCLSFLGTNLLIGGGRNVIYPWNRFDTNFNYPILIAESNIVKMVTVNTNTFVFAGNRGRIYITNGSQAQLYKKIPDHLSNTVEPYFNWGGACSTKNQLYFGFSVTTNALASITGYGGVWAIDLDTTALRLTNQLSYGTYAGYASALIAQSPALINPSNPAGSGLFIGWDSGASVYGVDKTITTPYTGSQAIIETDLIPIGTFDAPRNLTRIEFKLVKPLVSGESISVKSRTDFSQSYNSTPILSDSTVGDFSASAAVDFSNVQWVQFQITLNSTASSPSYVRLKQIRIVGVNAPGK